MKVWLYVDLTSGVMKLDKIRKERICLMGTTEVGEIAKKVQGKIEVVWECDEKSRTR